jgi:hypothetical protein
MKHLSAFLGVFLLATALLGQGANPAGNKINARTVYHPDGSRTESVNNPETRELSETVYDTRGVVISRRLYLLNERGQVAQGNIYDGAGNLVARSQSYFDEFGRPKEDRLVNLQGEVFQQTIHEYGGDGKARKPKVVNFSVKSPTMKPAIIDFTGAHPPPIDGTAAPATAAPPVNSAPPPTDDKPKKSFFKRLFDKKEKK